MNSLKVELEKLFEEYEIECHQLMKMKLSNILPISFKEVEYDNLLNILENIKIRINSIKQCITYIENINK